MSNFGVIVDEGDNLILHRVVLLQKAPIERVFVLREMGQLKTIESKDT